MSKSTGNFLTLSEAVNKFSADGIFLYYPFAFQDFIITHAYHFTAIIYVKIACCLFP